MILRTQDCAGHNQHSPKGRICTVEALEWLQGEDSITSSLKKGSMVRSGSYEIEDIRAEVAYAMRAMVDAVPLCCSCTDTYMHVRK